MNSSNAWLKVNKSYIHISKHIFERKYKVTNPVDVDIIEASRVDKVSCSNTMLMWLNILGMSDKHKIPQ